MIGVIAKIRIKPGHADEFERIFREISSQVRANEPENVVYDLFRSRSESDTYKVLEVYRSEEALIAHRESAHLQALVPNLRPLMEGRPDVEYLDGIN